MRRLLAPVSIIAAFTLAGCGPRLATTPYGEKEKEWAGYLRGAYSEWTPPQTIPPKRDTYYYMTDRNMQEKEAPEIFNKDEVIISQPVNYKAYYQNDDPAVSKSDALTFAPPAPSPAAVVLDNTVEIPAAPAPGPAVSAPAKAAAPAAAASAGAKKYRVQKGDCLEKISRKFYSTGAKVKAIEDANKALLAKSKGKLIPGTELVIP
jgi:nucleoid-associated protein YgaU